MNVVVFGAGAVGGYFGGRLADAGVNITFFVREKRAAILRQRGLRIHSVHGDFSLQPQVATSVHEAGKPDVVVIALKNYHLDAALPVLSEFVKQGAVLLPLLNGVQHMDKLVNEFGRERVLGGTCFIEVTLDDKGGIFQTSHAHDLNYGALTDMDEVWLQQLKDVFQRSSFVVRFSEHIRYDMWQKYLFLASFSGITAALRQPIGVVLNNSQSNLFLQGLIKEGCEVARAEGIPIPESFEETLVRRMNQIEPTMTSSLHRDLMKQLPLELDSLQGAMLRLAERHGIAVPYFRAVYQLLNPYQDGGLVSHSLAH